MNRILANLPHDEQDSFDTPDDDDTAPGTADESYEAEGTVTMPAPEVSEHALVTEPGGRRGTHYTCTCGEFDIYARNPAIALANFEGHKTEAEDDDTTTEIADAIVEAVPEGTPVAEVAAATAAVAVEFSNAEAEVEAKPKPKRKSANEDKRTPNQRAAANPVKVKCPKCAQAVDTIERAGIRIFTLHGDEAKGLDRCPGSTTVVQ
jgi:hypothetical protein